MPENKAFCYDRIFGAPSSPKMDEQQVGASAEAPASPEAKAPLPAMHDNTASTGSASASASALATANEPEPEDPPPPPVPLFSPATKPILDAASTRSISLLWEAQRQTGIVNVPACSKLPPCTISYTLQMQQVALIPISQASLSGLHALPSFRSRRHHVYAIRQLRLALLHHIHLIHQDQDQLLSCMASKKHKRPTQVEMQTAVG